MEVSANEVAPCRSYPGNMLGPVISLPLNIHLIMSGFIGFPSASHSRTTSSPTDAITRGVMYVTLALYLIEI